MLSSFRLKGMKNWVVDFSERFVLKFGNGGVCSFIYIMKKVVEIERMAGGLKFKQETWAVNFGETSGRFGLRRMAVDHCRLLGWALAHGTEFRNIRDRRPQSLEIETLQSKS